MLHSRDMGFYFFFFFCNVSRYFNANTVAFLSMTMNISLLGGGEFYDVILFVGPAKKQFKVYKGILSQNSGYFRNLFQSKGFVEQETNEVHLKDHEIPEMTVILRWLYEGKPGKSRTPCRSKL